MNLDWFLLHVHKYRLCIRTKGEFWNRSIRHVIALKGSKHFDSDLQSKLIDYSKLLDINTRQKPFLKAHSSHFSGHSLLLMQGYHIRESSNHPSVKWLNVKTCYSIWIRRWNCVILKKIKFNYASTLFEVCELKKSSFVEVYDASQGKT